MADLFDSEIISLFKSLNEQAVKYILVGGLAVNYHGFIRSTGDVDVWIDDSKTNRNNFVNALKNYGIEGAEIFYKLPFVAGCTEITLDNGVYIDLMSDLQFFKKENFEECYHLAPEFNIFENIIVKVLHINTLIAEKEKSNRPKDNLDAQELKKLYQL